MATIRFQIAPDVEYKMDMELEGVSAGSRDYDVQQHKAEVYKEFERRLKNAFPEGIKIDRFEFGLCLETDVWSMKTKQIDTILLLGGWHW